MLTHYCEDQLNIQRAYSIRFSSNQIHRIVIIYNQNQGRMKFISTLVLQPLLILYLIKSFTSIRLVKSFIHPNNIPLKHKQTLITQQQQQQTQPILFQQQHQRIITTKKTKTSLNVFGLGAPEIAIIVIAGAFLLGPQKLAEFGKDAGKIAGELKEVPKEFQKGLEEGKTISKAKNAKIMETADKNE